MTKAEREQIERDAKWWNVLADLMGWQLQGFTWRHTATYLTNLPQDDMLHINGHQRNQIVARIAIASERA